MKLNVRNRNKSLGLCFSVSVCFSLLFFLGLVLQYCKYSVLGFQCSFCLRLVVLVSLEHRGFCFVDHNFISSITWGIALVLLKLLFNKNPVYI